MELASCPLYPQLTVEDVQEAGGPWHRADMTTGLHGSASCASPSRKPAASLGTSGFLLALVLGVFRGAAAEADTNIRFTALRPDGKPAAGAKIHVVTFPTGQASGEWRSQADANGAFQMPVRLTEPRDGCLTVDAPDCSIGLVRLGHVGHLGLRPPQPGLPPSNHVLQLRPRWVIRGRVTDEAGSGIASAQVVTSMIDAHTYRSMWFQDARSGLLPELGTVSESNGDFTLRGAELVQFPDLKGSTGLTVFTHRDGKLWCGEQRAANRSKSSTDEAEPTQVVLRPTVTVSGQVVDRASGAALPGVRVSATGTGWILLAPTSTDDAGRFTITDIPSYARLEVKFSLDGHSTVRAFRHQTTREIRLQSIPQWKISLGRPVRIAGTVHDAISGGPPLVPVEIGIGTEDPQGDGWIAETDNIPSDTSGQPSPLGQFDVRIPAGPVKLTVVASTQNEAYQQPYRQTLPIEVPAGGKTNWSLGVERRPGILVQLEASDPQLLKRHGHGGDLLVEVRELGGGGTTLADYTPTWFFPAPEWGQKLEVRMLRRKVIAVNQTEDVEIQPWKELVADPKTWPIRLRVP